VDSAISSTPFADKFIKLSMQPCNLHRQINDLTEEIRDIIGCHLSNQSVCKISALLELPLSTVSAIIVKWKLLGATTAQLQSGWPHKHKEWDWRRLKRVALKNRLSSVATLTIEFQTASRSNVST
jgi:hypothetical protein